MLTRERERELRKKFPFFSTSIEAMADCGSKDAAAATALPPNQPSLFDRIGGMKALINAVDVFYERILADPTLAPFFEGVEMSKQRTKQVRKKRRLKKFSPSIYRFSWFVVCRRRRRRRLSQPRPPMLLLLGAKKKIQVRFLCYAFGGPDQYLGKSIAEAHERLIRERGVQRGHFWTVAQHLRDSLEQLQVPGDLIAECLSNVAPAASVFPEPGGAPVPGPEPVPAEGTPAAVRFFFFCSLLLCLFFFFLFPRRGFRRGKTHSRFLSLSLSIVSFFNTLKTGAGEAEGNGKRHCRGSGSRAAGFGERLR